MNERRFRLRGGVHIHGRWLILLMLPLLALVLFVAGVVVGCFATRPSRYPVASTPAEQVDQFRVFWEAWDQIEHKFYSPVPLEHRDMTYGAIRGMLASLGDPHTVLVEPPQHRLETDTFEGGFGGIGVVVAIEDHQPIIVEVHPGSPAEKAGLQGEDALLLVDGDSVSSLALDRVVLLLRGPTGSPVELVVRRSGERELSFKIVRERIELPSLTWQMLAADVGYVHIEFFSGRTGEELSHAVGTLREGGARALVLDLRSNGGGVVESAIDVLGQLIGHGIAFRELGQEGDERRHPIPFRLQTVDWPLAVLVDGGTASSAEIVAAAIRDYERGLLVGEPTLGKGSVQAIFPLQDGSSVHVTISRWLTSNGRPIEGMGLQPDIAVAAGEGQEDGDLSLQRAIEHLGSVLKGATRTTVLGIM
jgi:carboxyl-terminal processing protease